MSVTALCRKVGISRQAYYKEHRKREKQTIQGKLLLDAIKHIRRDHERMGE